MRASASHWSDRYVGQPYVPDEKDCGYYAELVQREVFGHELRLPSERAYGLRGKSKQIESLKLDYGVPTHTPQDGDGVLMIGRGKLSHVGVYCLIEGVAWVLHAARNAGQVVRHRLRELPLQGLNVEGFYRWK